MKSFKRTATISKRSPGILLRVPRRCTNGTEEVFHRRFIAIEQLAVEVTWVPIDYHTPQIEDCGTIFCHCKYILSFLCESSIMSVSRAMRNLFRAISLRVVSEARRGMAYARAQCVRALSIQRLEGSRPRLRWTRALCKFNGVEFSMTGNP